jgi:hypothetical protein
MVFGHSGAMKSRYTMHWGDYLYRKPTTDFTDEAIFNSLDNPP